MQYKITAQDAQLQQHCAGHLKPPCCRTWWEHGCCWLAAVQVVQVAAKQQLPLIGGSPVQRLATLSIPVTADKQQSSSKVQ
jgi:hypothetical protein